MLFFKLHAIACYQFMLSYAVTYSITCTKVFKENWISFEKPLCSKTIKLSKENKKTVLIWGTVTLDIK